MRPHRPGDERALVALFQEVFRRPIDETYWRWKLKALPSPTENVGVAVDEADRPVFQIGGIPGTWWIDHREALVMVAVDAMTHPRFRRRGILSQVGRQLFRNWRDAGVSLVLGLPNEQWGSR
ncbi:MAG TPA: GNAT family N-acetyltransferase, partial [Gemmatimonadaceae bacterium]|nr:GNAT family N-acetyltransferase [Gemmatimonadaceae bacterium]